MLQIPSALLYSKSIFAEEITVQEQKPCTWAPLLSVLTAMRPDMALYSEGELIVYIFSL